MAFLQYGNNVSHCGELVPEYGAHVSECGCFQQLAGDSCPHSPRTLKVLVEGRVTGPLACLVEFGCMNRMFRPMGSMFRSIGQLLRPAARSGLSARRLQALDSEERELGDWRKGESHGEE